MVFAKLNDNREMTRRIESFHRQWQRMRRMPCSYGFGVQSPFAYDFIRYVINERAPYYAYDTLSSAYVRTVSDRRKQMCRLFMRIANRMQPAMWVYNGGDTAIVSDYVHAGCASTRIVTAPPLPEDNISGVVCVAPSAGAAAIVGETLATAGDGSMLILERISSDKDMQRLWRKVVADEQVTLSFDLYHCGLAFIGGSYPKKAFRLNMIS